MFIMMGKKIKNAILRFAYLNLCIHPDKQSFEGKIVIISLSISLNMCFGCSKNHLSEMVIWIRPNKKISVF